VAYTAAQGPADVVGPVCESSDTFARGRLLPALPPQSLVAFLDAGAYGASMSSTYNARPLAAEVMGEGRPIRADPRAAGPCGAAGRAAPCPTGAP
jgi:diaminopimelate decarboxylase